MEKIEQMFQIEDESVEVIAAGVPGKNKKEKTFNCYILQGVANFLSSGTAHFGDKSARALCEAAGCYDLTNHSAHLKSRGNEFTGTKDKGWTLTAPGLKHGAALIKGLKQ